MRQIVLGYDGSKIAEKGISHILSLAKGFPDIHISIIHVIPYDQAKMEAVDLTDAFSKKNDERIQAIKKDFEAFDEQGLSYSIDILIGNPAEKLVEYAKIKDVDLIMVGYRGLNPIRETFVGSVSRKVIRESSVPVYVIK